MTQKEKGKEKDKLAFARYGNESVWLHEGTYSLPTLRQIIRTMEFSRNLHNRELKHDLREVIDEIWKEQADEEEPNER